MAVTVLREALCLSHLSRTELVDQEFLRCPITNDHMS
jgi:hypothetical protein